MANEKRLDVVLAALAIAVVLGASGAIYLILGSGGGAGTTSTTTIGARTNITDASTYAPAVEISEIAPVYTNATLDLFSCNTSEDCAIVRTQHCFNNLASQQACISRTYSDSYESYYSSYRAKGSIICAMYFIDANASCACISHGCSLVYTPISPR